MPSDSQSSRPDCEHVAHIWIVGQERCARCGLPWSELYDVVKVVRRDGSIELAAEPVEERPHPDRRID